jgi:hypothetical protein
MPRCPLCAKKLKTRMAVMAHMNQPLGACLPYIAEIAATQSDISVINEPANNASYQGFDTEISVNFQSASGACNMEEATMDVDDNSPLSPHEPLNSVEPTFEPIIKEHPSAGQTFGKGKTFLENFDTDAYASQRAANLYYPFSSKEEWELASFLLMSGLSMAKITKFLSLKLVCFFPPDSHANLLFASSRYGRLSSLSNLQKIFARGLRCFQRVPNGNSSLGKRIGRLKSLSCYSFATLLSVCSHYCTPLLLKDEFTTNHSRSSIMQED